MPDALYVVLLEDRHIDPQIDLFTNQDDAIAHARGHLEGEHEPQEEQLTPRMIERGWVFYATYGTEGDDVRVLARPVNTEPID